MRWEKFFHLYNSEHNTRRHCLKLATTRSRLELRRNFFSQRVVSHWNKLPTHVVEAVYGQSPPRSIAPRSDSPCFCHPVNSPLDKTPPPVKRSFPYYKVAERACTVCIIVIVTGIGAIFLREKNKEQHMVREWYGRGRHCEFLQESAGQGMGHLKFNELLSPSSTSTSTSTINKICRRLHSPNVSSCNFNCI